MGATIGAGTDATRVASFNPYISIYWLVSGKTLGGLQLYSDANRLTREEALRLYTKGSSWFSTEEDVKGALAPGQLADFAVLSADYFSIQEEAIKSLHSVLTVMGGEVVYAADEFSHLSPPPLPAALDWAPTAHYGGYYEPQSLVGKSSHIGCSAHRVPSGSSNSKMVGQALWGLGCDCFAF
jgi:hypothetical protein